MDLLNVYDNMQKEAALDAENRERVEILAKYASLAEELLNDKYGDDYNEADVTKLASYLIDNDVSVHEAQEKVAEYVEAGTVMARAFINEVNSSKG